MRLRYSSIPQSFIEATSFSPSIDPKLIWGENPAEPANWLESMVNYRRNFVPGGTYFFTVALRNRRSQQLTQSIGLLRQAFRDTLRSQPFRIDAIVVLPDHLHSIWTLPPGDSNYPARWKAIKSNFIRQLSQAGIPVEKRQDGSTLVWQRRYWEHTIRNGEDFNRHIDYIHINPVKHGLVKHVADWPYSTFHRYVAKGIYPPNWCSDVDYVIGGDE